MTKNCLSPQPTQDLNTVYLSVEVSRSSWVVGVYCPATDGKIRTHKLGPGSGQDVIDLAFRAQNLKGQQAPIVLCYEAGYEGFWLARYLERQAPDIEVVIIDPASLEVDRRAKTVKTDRIDAVRMIRALKSWKAGDGDVLARVRVPSIEIEDQRRIVRERDALLAERQRGRNRIRGLLHLQGIFGINPGSRDLLDRLAATKTGYGGPLPPQAFSEIGRIHSRLALINEQLAVVEADRNALIRAGEDSDTTTVEGMAATLKNVHGIGVNDVALLSTEVFCRNFKNRRQLGSWAGLTSAPWSSGSIDHDQGITKAGPARVRRHLIQMAWRWLRFQPTSKLTLWFKERTQDGHGRQRRRMIVALARKLLVALWQLATKGIVPEGVILK